MKIETDFRFVSNSVTVGPDELLAALVAAGHSNTRARRAVIAALCQAPGQASPADLLALGRAQHAELGIVTVYRTLDVLLALGLVRRLHTEDGCHTYALAAHDHGHHVICRECARVVEFEGCDISQVEAAVQVQTGFSVSGHWLEVFGLCPECQARQRGQTE